MKTHGIITIVMSFITLTDLFSQTSHPTVDYVKVSYQSSPQTTLSSSTGTLFEMSVVPVATVSLKTQTNVSKIYFKIQNTVTNSVVYNIDYNINAPTVISNGKILFENTNGNIIISSGQVIPLKPYSILVQTEDTLQNLSSTFSLIQ